MLLDICPSTFAVMEGYPPSNVIPFVVEYCVSNIWKKQAQDHLQLIQHHQSSLDKNHVVFAVVRDPIHRFVSALGQAMDLELGRKLRTKCLQESSSNETIHCVLLHLQKNGLGADVHFCPMAVNLNVVTRNVNITVALLPQYFLFNILDYLGFSSMYNMRNHSNPAYLQSNLLATLSADDLDAAAIQILCWLYAVDVEMMHSLGLTPVPLCNDGT